METACAVGRGLFFGYLSLAGRAVRCHNSYGLAGPHSLFLGKGYAASDTT